ncbi:hybrid sensor histidine kinase/response regulator [Pontibacter diazotrophicus]|uniref:histidine kinase n=1 Tax=Pontibacter diazotrophicus TaxID=1400979 RepID=A0A3D8L8L1_9BACT|nr:hybrid sensor histidine kinase/response regulator [Pontibacter diazotrophicus]RDV13636.1 hybrid sensor histidine kinase/response regulator [Pontibacter diazotrophicus]
MTTDPYTQPAALASGIHPVKILLVDDKTENLVSLESLLTKEDENITYLFASSGEEALKIALQEELALILLDVQMPGMNGYEVARYLRDISKTRNIPIIFVTAIDEQDAHVIEGFEAGAVDFLFKPLHPYITKAKVSTFVRFYLQKKELEKVNKLTAEINQQLEERVKERTRELTMVNKDLDNFVYTASHDLKAPINNIEGLMTALHETLQDKGPHPEGVAPIMEMMHSSISRFKNILLDLTEVAKVQYEAAAEKDKVSFKELLEEVKLNIKDMMEEHDAVITDDFSQAPEISFSRKNLRSILYNLVSNSIKYSSPDRKPEIMVTTTAVNDFTLLTVRDNGLGLRKQDQQKVFGMFKRLHTHVEGTGVGLAIVKRIVENCGGKIEFDSEVGKGSVFNVYLK